MSHWIINPTAILRRRKFIACQNFDAPETTRHRTVAWQRATRPRLTFQAIEETSRHSRLPHPPRRAYRQETKASIEQKVRKRDSNIYRKEIVCMMCTSCSLIKNSGRSTPAWWSIFGLRSEKQCRGLIPPPPPTPFLLWRERVRENAWGSLSISLSSCSTLYAYITLHAR